MIKHLAKTTGTAIIEFQGLAPRKGLTDQDQLAHFSKKLAQILGVTSLGLKDWSEALGALARLPLTKKTIVLLDEVSWMSGRDPDFAGYLKEAWDADLSQQPYLLLVLCGSVSSWIQKNILSNTGFAGRVSLEINLRPLSLFYSYELLQSRRKGAPIAVAEAARFFSIIGGIPRYIEEMDPKESAENNLKRSCFSDSGFLFTEFDKIFSEIFGLRHKLYKNILLKLTQGPLTPKQIADENNIPLNGDLIEYISALELSGFIVRDYNWLFGSGIDSKLSRVRLADPYCRFYLKYILQRSSKIKKVPHKVTESFDFFNWESVFGYQFENLIQNNHESLIGVLGIARNEIIQLGPYFQFGTKVKVGVQVDYLIQTKRQRLYLVEIKSWERVEAGVIDEVKEKTKKLKIPRGFSISANLVHLGEVSDQVIGAEYFDKIVSFEKLLRWQD